MVTSQGMPSRTVLFLGLLGLAVALPYLLREEGPLHDRWLQLRQGQWSSLWAAPAAASSDTSTGAAVTAEVAAAAPTTNRAAAPTTVPPVAPVVPPGRPVATRGWGGPPGLSLAEALRWDVTPAWVAQHWTRVTTQLPTTEYHGVRVPLVTGTELHDVAGSLSYYFNAQNQLERITLTGVTGDYEPLMALVQQRFGMTQYAAVGATVWMSFQQGVPIGILRIEDAAIQHAEQESTRYRMELEVNAPRPGATLSEPMLQQLRKWRAAKML